MAWSEKHSYITDRHRQQCGDSQRQRGWEIGRGGKTGKMRTERDFVSGDGLMMQCADDVLLFLKSSPVDMFM